MLSRLSLRKASLAHISLTLVGLMWVLPFLYYQHAYPLTTFYQEWGAVMLGLAAMPLLLTRRYWQAPDIPSIAALPMGILVLGLLQFLLGRIVYFDQALMLALYLMWAILLIMLGQRLRAELGLPQVAAVLALFLLLGAELNAAAGVLQHYRWHTVLDQVVTMQTTAAIYGNLAQPNHFADYMALGLASLGLLHARRLLPAWAAALLASPLLFVTVLSGSRSAWLYLLAMLALAYLWQRRDAALRPLWRYALLLLGGFALMHGVVELPWLNGAGGNVTTVQRLAGDVPSGSIRLYLWREAWHIFSQFPLLGAGFGQYGWQHFLWAPELQAPASVLGLYNNAHNLVMQLAAEMGLAGVLILLAAAGFWLHRVKQQSRTLERWWAYAVLAVLGMHSLLEYPLWYAYFLGVAAVTLGLTDAGVYRIKLRSLGRIAVGLMLLLGVVVMLQLFNGYRTLTSLTSLSPHSAVGGPYQKRLSDGLAVASSTPLLHPYAEYFMSNMIVPDADELERKLALNERVLHFVPVEPVVYRQAWLLALSGRQEEARMQMKRAIWSYPAEFAAARRELAGLAQKHPAQCAALLEFAVQENKEHQSGVRTK
ncbi:MAG TPA: Wzy polymerase domain-containing protein [Gallionellaceae bacterium]|nr:Wzy polymerase domain-containing protein [Gallionellaceae bacterium]